jgi:hypothetical protein
LTKGRFDLLTNINIITKYYWCGRHTLQRVGDMFDFVPHPNIAFQGWRWKHLVIVFPLVLRVYIAEQLLGFGELFLFVFLFSPFSLPKYKGVISFTFCIQFDPHFFIVICFFYIFFDWFFSLISSLIIWFHLILYQTWSSFFKLLFVFFFSNWILFWIPSLNILLI